MVGLDWMINRLYVQYSKYNSSNKQKIRLPPLAKPNPGIYSKLSLSLARLYPSLPNIHLFSCFLSSAKGVDKKYKLNKLLLMWIPRCKTKKVLNNISKLNIKKNIKITTKQLYVKYTKKIKK